MKKKKKKFDAVKNMREIRDRLSRKFADMSYEDEKKYIRENLGKKAAS